MRETAVFGDLKKNPRIFCFIGLGCVFLPGLLLFYHYLNASVRGPNPFLIVLQLMLGLLFFLIGLAMYLFADKKFNRKILVTALAISFQVAIIPVTSVIEDFNKVRFISGHKDTLIDVSNRLITGVWDLAKARNAVRQMHEPLYLDDYLVDDKTVLFMIHGMIDNCYGIAYSLSGKKPLENNCGQLIRWKRLSGNWYAWATT